MPFIPPVTPSLSFVVSSQNPPKTLIPINHYCIIYQTESRVTKTGEDCLIKVKLDFTSDCKSSNCIYLAVCRHCPTREFYFGQTTNALHLRFNGHRSCFKTGNLKFNDSALSYHVYTSLLEDYFIYSTKADTISLNRYKVMT